MESHLTSKKGGDTIKENQKESVYKLSKAEKETILLWNEEEDEPITIDTFDQKIIERLMVMVKKHPDIYKVNGPDKFGGYSATVPKSLVRISFMSPLSDQQRKQMSTHSKSKNLISHANSKH